MSGYYFRMIADGQDRGVFKVLHTHLIGKTLTYRPARWHERLWIWLTRKTVGTRVLRYSNAPARDAGTE